MNNAVLPVSLLSAFLMALSGLTSIASAESEKPKQARAAKEKSSIFRKDKAGVLWFEPGTDGETEYSAGMALSAKNDGITIVVSSSKKHMEKGVGLAIKIRNAIRKSVDKPDHVKVVAFISTEAGIGYRFYTDGLYYGMDKLGVFGPADAKKQISKVITQHQLLKKHVKEGRYGKDHSNFKSLKIVEK